MLPGTHSAHHALQALSACVTSAYWVQPWRRSAGISCLLLRLLIDVEMEGKLSGMNWTKQIWQGFIFSASSWGSCAKWITGLFLDGYVIRVLQFRWCDEVLRWLMSLIWWSWEVKWQHRHSVTSAIYIISFNACRRGDLPTQWDQVTPGKPLSQRLLWEAQRHH